MWVITVNPAGTYIQQPLSFKGFDAIRTQFVYQRVVQQLVGDEVQRAWKVCPGISRGIIPVFTERY
jgi:hypothetical protein